MKKVSLNQLNNVFAAIAKDGSLYIPVDTDAGVAKFEKWEDGKELSKAPCAAPRTSSSRRLKIWRSLR